MHLKKKAVLLVNVGTPDKPMVKHVRKYLSRFLNDGRVIGLPWFLRTMLVNLVIVPFRAAKSAKLYNTVWTEKGSPLLVYLNILVARLQTRLGENYAVYGAMRYGNPSLKKTLGFIATEPYEEIIILPLFPQYASSTTGSVTEFIMSVTQKWNVIPTIRFIHQFYSHPAFIDAFVARIKEHQTDGCHYVIFSYHGLPVQHIRKVHPSVKDHQCTCVTKLPQHGTHCYKATCYETTRLLAEKLKLTPGTYATSFQSRLSQNWLTPFTDKMIIELAGKGIKKILVVAPSFVADCLETLVEIKNEYSKLFKHHGGEELILVESLNDKDEWIEAIAQIIK